MNSGEQLLMSSAVLTKMLGQVAMTYLHTKNK
jgi:hypothetical protein